MPTSLIVRWFRQPWLKVVVFLSIVGALRTTAHAQPLEADLYKFASPWDAPAWNQVNPEAWDSFKSFDATRIFGNMSQQDFTVSTDYTNRVIYLGKKATGAASVSQVTWVGPLFGGEGYTAAEGIIPLSSPYAQCLSLTGGWRYHLLNSLDIDLGGDFIFYNKSVFGQGLPAPWGGKNAGPVYVGFAGRVLGRPSVYFKFDPELGQYQETFSVEHVWDLQPLTGITGLHAGAKFLVGLLQANDYNMGDKVLGQNWRNGYAYFEAEGNVDYEVFHHVYLRTGVTWAMNNDGSGSSGIARTNLGPDNNVSFRAGVLWSF